MSKKEERRFYAKVTSRLLCPKCEGKSVPQLIIENRESIPLLVIGMCEKCGYHGSLVEIGGKIRHESESV